MITKRFVPMFSALIGAAAVFAANSPGEPAQAADLRTMSHHRHLHVRPSVDAVELATLAPPEPFTTAQQDYGDAAFARARAQRFIEHSTTDALAPYPCDPHIAISDGMICANVPGRRGYGQYYAFTPDYLTAPQISGADPSAQTSLLPPATILFLNANAAFFGSR